MANLSKPQIQLSRSDFKKASLNANKKLEARNKSIESSIKAQEKQLKSLEKQYSSESKKLNKLLIDVEFQEDKFQKIKGGIYSNDKLLAEKLKKIGNAEKELCEYESATEKLGDREIKLKKDIEALEFYKAKCSESKSELSGIQVQKDSALDELANVKAEIDQLYIDHNSKVLSYESKYANLEEEAKNHEDMVHRFEQRLFEAKDQALEEEKKLEDVLSKAKKEKKKVDDELQAVKNLVSNTEDEYIRWEQKVAKITAKADREEGRIKTAKERYENWRIGILEEVARLKLKSKVDKIDKAGLSEILNG